MVGTAGWVWTWGGSQPAEALALRYELGCSFAEIALAVLQTLILSLRIADGLGQHLAKLVLGPGRLARDSFLPCCHG